jgi:VWFA-related protein
LSGLPAAGPAQRPTAGETIEVSIVNVDVFVTDKSGNRVRGLTRDDFEVFENGVKQPITNFAEYAGQDDATAGVELNASPIASPQKRTIAVFVERFRLPKVHADPVFTSMKKLLRDAVRPGDAVTVVTWYKGRLTTIQTYTDDLAAIDRALDTIARQNTSATLDDFANQRTWYDDIEDYDLRVEEMAGGDPALVAAIRESAEDSREMSSRMNARRERWDLELKVATINALMRSMSGFDGKRFLLLATHRLSQIAGAEHLYAAGITKPELDSLDRIEFDTRKIMKTLYDTANANGVAVYPMFPEGIIS